MTSAVSSSSGSNSLRPNRYRKAAKWLVALVACYVVVGVLIVPVTLRYILANQVAQALHRQVVVDRVAFNPFTLVLIVNGLQVKDRQGKATIVGFDRLDVDLEAASLWKRALIVRSLHLDGPSVAIVRNLDQSYNFSDLVGGSTAGAEPAPSGPGLLFSINNIVISGGNIEFQDRPKELIHRVQGLHLALPFLANLDHLVEIFTTPAFYAEVNGTHVNLAGKSKPFVNSRDTALELNIADLDLTRYLSYLPAGLGVGLRSGTLSANLSVAFVGASGGGRFTLGGSATLTNAAVTDSRGQDLLTLRRVLVGLAPSDLLRRDIHLSVLELDAPHLFIKHRTDGSLNIHDLLGGSGGQDTKTADPVAGAAPAGMVAVDRIEITDLAVTSGMETAGTDQAAEELVALPRLAVADVEVDLGDRALRVGRVATVDGTVRLERRADSTFIWQDLVPAGPPPSEPLAAEPPQPEEASPAWQVALGDLDLQGYTLHWSDLAAPAPAALAVTDISFEAADFSTAADAGPADLAVSLVVNDKGRLQVDGTLSMTPFAAHLDCSLVDLALKPFVPYLADRLDLLVAGGTLAATGHLDLTPGQESQPLLAFKGKAAVNDFATRDPLLAEPLLAWQSLQVDGIDCTVAPTAVRVDSVRLDKPYARLVISDKGKLNLLAVLKKDNATAAKAESGEVGEGSQGAVPEENEAEADGTAPLVLINTVACRDGRFDFEDRSIAIGYKASLSALSGEVAGLSSLAEQVAKVELNGTLDQHSPLAVSGTVNPLRQRLWADLVVRCSDIGMSGLSPYAGKYIGYRLEKGKLGFDLRYKVDDRQLDADNRIFMDQLTLGESVESTDAVDLPIRLAIALLRNRAGEIRLDVPVSGNLDDPDFSLASTVVTVFVNLIAKAVTSPFALLGALVGGGEELQYVDFAPAAAGLTGPAQEKLASLAKVLADRPGLNLDITGRADPVADRQALHELFFIRLLKAEKLKELVRGNEAVVGEADQVVIAPDEYEEYLTRAYKAATFERPRNFLGLIKGQPPEEMKRLLSENIEVRDADLLDLATRRAQQVREFLVGQGGLAAERLFVLDAKLWGGEAQEPEAARRRVELAVR